MCWQAELKQALNNLAVNGQPARVALLGIGSELRGDDRAGVWLADRLLEHQHPHLLVIPAGLAPENFTGNLRAFKPQLVILADAAELEQPPGSVRFLDWQQTGGISASTHTLPLHLLAGYLQTELGCQVSLLAIQPAQTGFDQPLSVPVQNALQETAADLVGILTL
ncbi:MAG: hydrogenase 3 maturation endopeptidase HyCI [Anaerolineales bacterium]|nr:hydrogenase 3 maturation endopeptidase HyCI [Anaerolineales bacterium]